MSDNPIAAFIAEQLVGTVKDVIDATADEVTALRAENARLEQEAANHRAEWATAMQDIVRLKAALRYWQLGKDDTALEAENAQLRDLLRRGLDIYLRDDRWRISAEAALRDASTPDGMMTFVVTQPGYETVLRLLARAATRRGEKGGE